MGGVPLGSSSFSTTVPLLVRCSSPTTRQFARHSCRFQGCTVKSGAEHDIWTFTRSRLVRSSPCFFCQLDYFLSKRKKRSLMIQTVRGNKSVTKTYLIYLKVVTKNDGRCLLQHCNIVKGTICGYRITNLAILQS